MTETTLHQVDIELKRVQTFIFDVPRLKAMLGANALIGETLRHELPELACNAAHQAVAISPEGLHLPAGDPDDPLGDDDPAALYRKGVLVRDGGRFKAVFDSESKARAYARAAESLLVERLPGALFEIEVRRLGDDTTEAGRQECKVREEELLDLPVLQVCQETGKEPASGRSEKDRWAAASVLRRLEKGGMFYKGESRDVIGLMRSALGLAEQSGWQEPDDLGDLCAGGYLALVHADGNAVGARYSKWKEKVPERNDVNPLRREAHGERFFHSMRVAVRKSVVAALCGTFTARRGKRPYQVLMLGGDDLLVACRADRALDFVRNYAREMSGYTLVDGRPLTIGAGVAIAKDSYPLHQLHELAEALASSAKRLYRALPENEKCSVVDWQVVTQSWFDDVAAARRQAEFREYLVGGTKETLVLTARPYRVLEQAGKDSLTALLDAVARLEGARSGATDAAARSPLRALRSAFEAGRLSGEMAFNRLDEPVRQALAGGDGASPWQPLSNNTHLTRVLDIVGIREISRLGGRKSG